MTRFQDQFREVDGDQYKLSHYRNPETDQQYYAVRRLVSGGPEAEVVGSAGNWLAKQDGVIDDQPQRTLLGAICRLRELGWVGKYR